MGKFITKNRQNRKIVKKSEKNKQRNTKNRQFKKQQEFERRRKKREKKQKENVNLPKEYYPKENVDYDCIIIISSFERYNKLRNILEQLFSQETKYTFKVIILNDGSEDKNYNTLQNEFTKIEYYENATNNGKDSYWKSINFLLKKAKQYKTHSIIQMDDDFILCKSFIDLLMDKFFEVKYEDNKYMAIRYHVGKLDTNYVNEDYFDYTKRFQGVDGGTLFDTQFLDIIDYKIANLKDVNKNAGSGVWGYFNDIIKQLSVLVYTLRESLAFHNDEHQSKMHPDVRKKRKLYTINFIENE